MLSSTSGNSNSNSTGDGGPTTAMEMFGELDRKINKLMGIRGNDLTVDLGEEETVREEEIETLETSEPVETGEEVSETPGEEEEETGETPTEEITKEDKKEKEKEKDACQLYIEAIIARGNALLATTTTTTLLPEPLPSISETEETEIPTNQTNETTPDNSTNITITSDPQQDVQDEIEAQEEELTAPLLSLNNTNQSLEEIIGELSDEEFLSLLDEFIGEENTTNGTETNGTDAISIEELREQYQLLLGDDGEEEGEVEEVVEASGGGEEEGVGEGEGEVEGVEVESRESAVKNELAVENLRNIHVTHGKKDEKEEGEGEGKGKEEDGGLKEKGKGKDEGVPRLETQMNGKGKKGKGKGKKGMPRKRGEGAKGKGKGKGSRGARLRQTLQHLQNG